MTDPTGHERTATPLSQSVELALTHQPDVKYKYGTGRLRPERVVFYYLNDRTNAHLHGVWIREDGEPTDDPCDQDYRHDVEWPGWLAEMARDRDPRAVPAGQAPSTDQTALRDRIAEALADADGWKWAPGFKDQSPTWQGYQTRADAVLSALPASVDRAAVLREAADICDEAGAIYGSRGANDAAGAAFALMERFQRKANEAEYVATPCDSMNPCEDGGEPCHVHERLMAHGEGDHELCAPDCGVVEAQSQPKGEARS
jgi:hypothetical protein